MTKDLEYYLKLKYPLTIKEMEHSDGGYYAHYYDFGQACAHGDGATIEEAIAEADISKELVLEHLLENNLPVPEPDSSAAYSGKFTARVPRTLHRQLAEEAERENTSLNMLVVNLLSQGLQKQSKARSTS